MDALFDIVGSDFFKPLSGKHRALYADCITALFERLHGPYADYRVNITQRELRELFHPLVATHADQTIPAIPDEEPDLAGRDSDRVRIVIRRLLETGWPETRLDKGTMVSVYGLSRPGKALADTLYRLQGGGMRTIRRNVRSTRNSLEAYVRSEGREPYELLDAFDAAQRIMSDLSDDIDALELQRRKLTEDVARSRGEGIGEILHELRLRLPEVTRKFTVESVVQHRGHIESLLDTIEHWPPERRETADRAILAAQPVLGNELLAGESALWWLTGNIRERVTAAMEVKMPELREAVSNFGRRIQLIVMQQSALATQGRDTAAHLIERLKRQPRDRQEALLSHLAGALLPLRVRLPDPERVTVKERVARRKPIDTGLAQPRLTREERRQAHIQQALETAFALTEQEVDAYVLEQMGAARAMSLRHFRVSNALALLALSHSIEVAAHRDTGYEWDIVPERDEQGRNRWFDTGYGCMQAFTLKRRGGTS